MSSVGYTVLFIIVILLLCYVLVITLLPVVKEIFYKLLDLLKNKRDTKGSDTKEGIVSGGGGGISNKLVYLVGFDQTERINIQNWIQTNWGKYKGSAYFNVSDLDFGTDITNSKELIDKTINSIANDIDTNHKNMDRSDIIIIILTPRSVMVKEFLEGREPADGIYYSYTYTRKAPREIYIDGDNWANGVDRSTLTKEQYRQYVINHEVGHALGYDHKPCDTSDVGGVCSIMHQMTVGIPKGKTATYTVDMNNLPK